MSVHIDTKLARLALSRRVVELAESDADLQMSLR